VLNATNINHVSYQVSDYARTRDFYVGLFGMKVSEDNGKQCRLSFGNNMLVVRNRQPRRRSTTSHTRLPIGIRKRKPWQPRCSAAA